MAAYSHLSRHRATYVFGAVATSAYVVGIAVVTGLDSIPRVGTVIAAATIDIVVMVPLAYFLLVVRPGNARVGTVIPVVVVGMTVASLVVPNGYDGTLRILQIVCIPLEVGLLSFVAFRAYRTVHDLRSGSISIDPVERFNYAAESTIGGSLASRIASTELSVLYYALCSFRSKPHVPVGATGHSVSRRSGHAGIVLAVAVLLVMEAVPVHLLVGLWSGLVAWIVTISSGYGLLLIFGDYRATVLRPVLIDGCGLVLRAGLRWNTRVPLRTIVRIESESGHRDSSLDVTLTGTATHWLQLSEPVVVHGIYGIQRKVTAIGIQPDDPDRFIGCLDAAIRTSAGNDNACG